MGEKGISGSSSDGKAWKQLWAKSSHLLQYVGGQLIQPKYSADCLFGSKEREIGAMFHNEVAPGCLF